MYRVTPTLKIFIIIFGLFFGRLEISLLGMGFVSGVGMEF